MTLDFPHVIAAVVVSIVIVAGMYLKVIPSTVGEVLLGMIVGFLFPTSYKSKDSEK